MKKNIKKGEEIVETKMEEIFFLDFYQKLNDYFYFFEVSGCRIGYSFADITDALYIFDCINNLKLKDKSIDKNLTTIDIVGCEIPKPSNLEVIDNIQWNHETACINFKGTSADF